MAKKKIVTKSKVLDSKNQLSLVQELESHHKLNKLPTTQEQDKFINFSGDESVILSATAGSGKTFSCVQRLKTLISRGVDPGRIIFFSFTKAATEELSSRIGRDDIQITTIHAFCLGILSKVGKYREIASFYDFISWFKEKYKPSYYSSEPEKEEFMQTINRMYEDADFLSSSISAFKLQSADGIKSKLPDYFYEYVAFLRDRKSRDFADMLIEVRDLLREDKWLRMFRDKFDYIFVDEYQDTSSIQMEILLALNAKFYYLIGDKFQSIFGYSGANCDKLEGMLNEKRKTTRLMLSINFRSDMSIVENSNKYSSLKAFANSKEKGFVNTKILLKVDELVDVLNSYDEIVVLVRTNDVIKRLEADLLKRRYPMQYKNIVSDSEMKKIMKGEEPMKVLAHKWPKLRHGFNNIHELIYFIKENSDSKKFITTIHKSKGREFDYCVVVNSISPEVLRQHPKYDKLTKKHLQQISFEYEDEDVEPKNIHYVAVSRSRHGLYFMVL